VLISVLLQSNQTDTHQPEIADGNYDAIGELSEYVGFKIDRNKETIRIMQPVLNQSFSD